MSIPKLLTAEQLTGPLQMKLPAVYDFLNTLPDGPDGIIIRFGRRIRVKEDALLKWLADGGR